MKRIKRIISLCLALLMVVTICPQKVEAASYDFHFNNIEIVMDQSNTRYGYWMLDSDTKAKITKVTISNKALASVSIDSNKKEIWFSPKKAGSTTVKVTVKNGSKKKVHTVKLKIYKYENPMTSLKVGKKQYKSKFDTKKNYYEKKPKKASTVKVNVKAKKGYEINNISYASKVNGEYKYKTLTNGQSFKLDKNTQYLAISFRNKKTGCTYSTYINYFY